MVHFLVLDSQSWKQEQLFSKQKLNPAFSFCLYVQEVIRWHHTSKPWKLTYSGEIWASFYDDHCPFIMSWAWWKWSAQKVGGQVDPVITKKIKKTLQPQLLPAIRTAQPWNALGFNTFVGLGLLKKSWHLIKHLNWYIVWEPWLRFSRRWALAGARRHRPQETCNWIPDTPALF